MELFGVLSDVCLFVCLFASLWGSSFRFQKLLILQIDQILLQPVSYQRINKQLHSWHNISRIEARKTLRTRRGVRGGKMKQFRKLNFIVEYVFFVCCLGYVFPVYIWRYRVERARASLLTKLHFFFPPFSLLRTATGVWEKKCSSFWRCGAVGGEEDINLYSISSSLIQFLMTLGFSIFQPTHKRRRNWFN